MFHLQPDEHEKVFTKLYGWLKDGGYLLFTHGGNEGQIQGEMYGENFSYNSLGPAKTKLFLENLGFKIIEWSLDTSESNS
ncbi:MAG: hypothetical protein WAN61_02885 [Minisyncoccia bacterium]